MMKLLVNNVEVGEYSCFCSQWEIDLKQQIDIEAYLYQIVYYCRDFADFFAIYGWEDMENDIYEYYLIDSRSEQFDDELDEYQAEKLEIPNQYDLDKYIMSLILEQV